MRSTIISTTSDHIASGGTITGDLTISGDLTVEGDNSGAYSEIITDGLQITKDTDGEFVSLILVNESNAADTTGIISQRFDLEDTGGTAVDSGKILVGKEASFTATASTQDSYMALHTSLNGTLAEKVRITSAGAVEYPTSAGKHIWSFANESAKLVINNGAAGSQAQLIIEGEAATDDAAVVFRPGAASNYTQAWIVGPRFYDTSGDDARALHIGYGSDYSAGGSKLTIQTNGNVGIGTSAPSTLAGNSWTDIELQVKGTSGGGSMAVSGATQAMLFLSDEDASSNAKVYGIASVGDVFRIDAWNDNESLKSTHLVLDANSRISLSNNDSNTGNTVFGKSAWNNSSDNASDYNTIFGEGVMGTGAVAGAVENTVVGYTAGQDLTSGDENTLIGSTAGANLTTVSNNTVVGRGALYTSTAAVGCVAIGHQAMYAGTATQAGTVAVGKNALNSLSSGAGNTAVGYTAMNDLVDGTQNTAIGYNAFGGTFADTTADGSIGNIFIGYNAGSGNWTTAVSNYNVAVGNSSMDAAMNGATSNTSIGTSALSALTEGDSNTAIGRYAGGQITTAGFCTLVGHNAGQAITTTGGSNESDGTVAVGYNALTALTSGAGNVAVGYTALSGLTTGDGNTVLGHNAANSMVLGESHNVIIGTDAMGNVDEGTAGGDVDANVAIGYAALYGGDFAGNDRQLNGNVAIGYGAMDSTGANAQTGTIAIGHSALTALTSGERNTAVGYQAGKVATTGADNTFIGYGAADLTHIDASSNTIVGKDAFGGDHDTNACHYNTVIGKGAMAGALDGVSGAVAIGKDALTALTTGTGNVAVGYLSGKSLTTADNNTFVGQNTGEWLAHDTANGNVAVGFNAMGGGDESTPAGNTASYNIAIGGNTVGGTTASTTTDLTAANNVGIGWGALATISTGSHNIAIGKDALNTNTTGANNVAIGGLSMSANTTGANNTAVGYQSLDAADDNSNNTAVGYQALTAAHNASADYGWNTAVGKSAGGAVSTGYRNVLIGESVCTTGTNNLTTGNSNTVIGTMAIVSAADADNQIVIGKSATGQANNSVTLGNADVTDVYMAQDSQAYVHSQNVPNHVANTMSSPYYRFDGVNDYISGTNNQQSFPFYLETLAKWDTFASTGVAVGLVDESNASKYIQIRGHGNGNIEVWRRNTTDYSAIAVTSASVDTWYHILAYFESATSLKIYVNGNLVLTDASASSAAITSDFDKSVVGVQRLASATGYMKGEVALFRVGNHEPTAAEVKALYSGASVPFKYKGANQTEQTSGTLTIGKAYRINDWISGDDFTNIGGTNADGNEFVATGQTPTTWSNSSKVVPIGAVAEYDGSGIGPKWNDKSGNDLHGTVSGSTVENAPADADSGLTYEEGTWTPNLDVGGSTSSTTVDPSYDRLHYTKIGRIVHLTGGFRISAIDGPSGAIGITGLPFTVANMLEDGNQVAAAVWVTHGTGTVNAWMAKTVENATYLDLEEFAGTTSANAGDHLAAGTRIVLSVSYLADVAEE